MYLPLCGHDLNWSGVRDVIDISLRCRESRMSLSIITVEVQCIYHCADMSSIGQESGIYGNVKRQVLRCLMKVDVVDAVASDLRWIGKLFQIVSVTKVKARR